jgi:type I restriction enzyme M protein
MFVERTGNHEKFTIDYLDRYADIRRSQLDEVMNDLFEDTKKHYKADDLFGKDDALQISFATFRRIVQKLQKFNLAATSDDVKGIAFEKFLGQTFRGELGQFFTPRPIVDFMVELLDPKEGEVLCDPASGSGGFLIKFFEHVRSQIEEDVQNKKHAARKLIEREELDEDAEGERLNNVFAEMNAQLDIGRDDSRLWKVAHDCIFGTDAEPRAARTSKMNMIMHGDGHGGIHHHDGFVDVNGIFPDRFNIVLTNPPFGSKVGKDQKVGTTPETKVGVSPEIRRGYEARFGDTYKASYERMRVAEQSHTPILDLYDLGQKQDSVKSEILFLERCLKLLIPGGKLGIVVPDGVLNNPSLIEVRRYLENRAKLLAVVSIPDKTFRSAKTAVKASLLFLQRLSEEEQAAYETTREKKAKEEHARLGPTIDQYELALSVTWTQYRRAQEAKVTVADSEGIRRPVRRARDTRRRTAATTARALGQQEAIAAAEKLWGCALDAETFKQSRSLARVRLRELKTEIDENVFNAVRKKYDYPIFMAVAEHVGIRGSGKTDPENELPQVAAEWRAFLKNPTKITPDVSRQVFRMNWSELDRWDPTSFRPIEWKCSPELLRPIGKILRKRIEPVSEEIDFTDLTPITIHFDGSVEQRDTSDTDEYTMELFFAQPGDIVLSKIDLKNGAVGLVPEKLKNVAVTNHFVVYEPDAQQLYPPYLIRLIQATFFKDYLWRKKVGSEGRKEVKIELFESTLIPLPDVETQKKLVEQWVRLEKDKAEIEKRIEENRKTLDPELLAGTPAQRSTEAARG